MVLISIMIKTKTKTINANMYFKFMKHTEIKSRPIRFIPKIHISTVFTTIVSIRCHIHNNTPFSVTKQLDFTFVCTYIPNLFFFKTYIFLYTPFGVIHITTHSKKPLNF